MKNLFTLFLIIVSINGIAQRKNLTVDFNKNIEFLGYIIEQGDPSNNDKEHPISKVIHKYPNDKNMASLSKLFELASDLDYSTLIHLMYYLPEFPIKNKNAVSDKLALYVGFTTKDEIEKLNILISELNNFYNTSNFEQVWKDLKSYRKEVKKVLKKEEPKPEVFNQMENFYQQHYQQYTIIPSVTLWQAGFGIRDIENQTAVYILGPLGGNYDFNNSKTFTNLAIHEFGHSFVNHVLLKNKKELLKTKRLFVPIKPAMKKQGYSNWETCMIEHFVRAGEVIVRDLTGNKTQSDFLLKTYAENKEFIYLRFIISKLAYYRMEKELDYDTAVLNTLIDLGKENPTSTKNRY